MCLAALLYCTPPPEVAGACLEVSAAVWTVVLCVVFKHLVLEKGRDEDAMIASPILAEIKAHKAVIPRVREWGGLAVCGWSGLGLAKLVSCHSKANKLSE